MTTTPVPSDPSNAEVLDGVKQEPMLIFNTDSEGNPKTVNAASLVKPWVSTNAEEYPKSVLVPVG